MWHKLCFFRASVRDVRDSGRCAGKACGHDSCCCSAVSQPANGLSKLVSAMGRCGRSFVFLGRQYATSEIRGAVLGRHVGHDSCCCSAVSEPANGLSKLVRCGISFVFFRASVCDVRDSGRRAGKACWARFLLLFGCFGTSQWTLKAGFCNR